MRILHPRIQVFDNCQMINFNNFSKVKVLVVGDVMLDRYWWGDVSRISPEAPVPVVKLEKSTYSPGGAGNVARNVAGLGAVPYLVGIVGNDGEADLVTRTLEDSGVAGNHLIRIAERPTTVKTRVIAHGQQVARIDQETDTGLASKHEGDAFEQIKQLLEKVDVIIVSDYAKGFLTRPLLTRLIAAAHDRNKSILVDPKGKDYSKYDGADLLTPNKREAADAAGIEFNEGVAMAGTKLMSQLTIGALLITQGEDGMTLFRPETEPFHLSSLAREVYDVTGAGDTVIASLAVAIGAGNSLEDASNLANIAAGIVVGQIGATSIRTSDLESAAMLGDSRKVG